MYQIRQDGKVYNADENTFRSWLFDGKLKDTAELWTEQGWRLLKGFSDCTPHLVPTQQQPVNWGAVAAIGGGLLGGAFLLSELFKSEKTKTAKSDTPTRRLFLSFAYEDKQQVDGFRLLPDNKNVDIEFRDGSLRHSIGSENEAYIKRRLREQMNGTSVCVCLIGEKTHKSGWVEWEVETCAEDGKGILGIRLKGSSGRIPPVLTQLGAKTIDWDPHAFADEIEKAAKDAGR